MGVRITITCGCDVEDPHYYCEPGQDMEELWFDVDKVLSKLGIGTLASIGELDEDESNEEFLLVRIEPSVFVGWLDEILAKQASIQAAYRAAGKPDHWSPKDLQSVEPLLRELAEHCRSASTHVEASFG